MFGLGPGHPEDPRDRDARRIGVGELDRPARVLISAALAAAKLLETGELEGRIESLEDAIGVGRPRELEVDPTWP